MKILIISQNPWREDNSFGNSFSNIFGGMKNVEIANIYCGPGLPNTNVVKKFYQTNERMLVKNLIFPKSKSGSVVDFSEINNQIDLNGRNESDLKKMRFFKKNRFQLFFWIRELIWKLGRWDSPEMKKFIDDFQPDIIFLPIFYWPYINRIGIFVKKYTNKKMVGYISDDHYSLKQRSYNPFFWFERLLFRTYVKKAIKQCEILYVISSIQKKDYDKSFNKDCKLLYKGIDFEYFDKSQILLKDKTSTLVFLFTGNVGSGRYKTLSKIGESLDEINVNGTKAILKIYSNTELNKNMKLKLLSKKSIVFGGAISFEQVKKEQKEADILVHVESFDSKDKLLVRQSFSTKIVDYLQEAKCIFAVGTRETASINYLISNDAAIVATSEIQIHEKVKKIMNNRNLLTLFGDKAWNCGKKNHNIIEIQDSLYNDLEKVIGI